MSIPINPRTGFPEYWHSWSPGLQKAWLEKHPDAPLRRLLNDLEATRQGSNIPINPKTRLPEFWKTWSRAMQEGWLQKNLYEPFKRNGIDLKKMIDKTVERELLTLRACRAVRERLDNPIFTYDLEWKLGEAVQAYLRRGKVQAPAARPVTRPVSRPAIGAVRRPK